MRKKIVSKRAPRKHSKNDSPSVYIRYVSIVFIIVILVLIGNIIIKGVSKTYVLGTNTSPVLLADHGSDDSGGSGSSDGGGSGGGSSGGSSSGSSGGSSSSGGDNHGESGSNGSSGGSGGSQQSVSDSTQDDCVGPDGKHFTTSFKNCSDLNNAWHHSNFSFTSLSTPQTSAPVEQKSEAKPSSQPAETETATPKPQAVQQNTSQSKPEKFEVMTEDRKTRLDLEQNGVKVRIEKEGDTLKVKAEKADGTEVELEAKDSLETLNKELETEGVEVAKTADNNVMIKKGDVEAETELPISVDPTTHELTVTTPAGTKTVTVLPDQAVNNLFQNKLLTSVESQVSSQSGTTTQNVTLTEVGNELTFAVKGISQKKILGVIPVGFAKTAFVSATTGQVVKTDEPFVSRVLELFSF